MTVLSSRSVAELAATRYLSLAAALMARSRLMRSEWAGQRSDRAVAQAGDELRSRSPEHAQHFALVLRPRLAPIILLGLGVLHLEYLAGREVDERKCARM